MNPFKRKRARTTRRQHLFFRFLHCAECGGGKRRHVAQYGFYEGDGWYWACSRRHQQFVPFTKAERWQRDSIRLLKDIYKPLIDRMVSCDQLYLKFRQ